ncbi:molybdate ABC transporter substrate-binding protein [Ilumatobacter sp.]|uniref:molybdate ABC transporter substrate-binding protein n=1 Tax=Ilumatobacter sp. TaxID=1967498 RepID=UPI003C5B6CC2
MPRIATALAAVTILVMTTAACGDSDEDGSVLVLAASSLTDAFTAMEAEFEAAHDVDVELSFGGSSTLRVQVEQGAPAAVVAFADTAPMDALVAGGFAEAPETFATNSMTLVIPADNPGDVSGLADLTDPGLLVGVCAPQVPCGRYAQDVLTQAGVAASVDTEEPDVRSLAAKIAAGELDAGLIYTTDVDAFPGELTAIELPDGIDVRADYPIAIVDGTSARSDAELFVDFVLSPAGQAILTDAGFGEV